MSSDLDVIKAIVNAFERSDWAEIDVISGSLRVHLSTQPQPLAGSAPAIPAEHSARLIALGYMVHLEGRLRMTTAGRVRIYICWATR